MKKGLIVEKILPIMILIMIIRTMMMTVAMTTSVDMDMEVTDAIMTTTTYKMTTRPADGVYLNGQCRNIVTVRPL